MANTKSAKKAVRGSARKRSHNLMWKTKFKQQLKVVSKAIAANETEQVILEKFKALQTTLDKASKEKVIHKNKANRVKSNYAKRIAAHLKGGEAKSEKTTRAKARSTKKRSK